MKKTKHDDHDLIGWDVTWKAFCDVFDDLHESNPEWVTVTRYLTGVVGTNHQHTANSLKPSNIEEDKTKLPVDGEGILFIPMFNRDYCLGVCHELSKTLREASDFSMHFITPTGEVAESIADDKELYWHSKNVLRKWNTSLSIWAKGFSSYRKGVKAIAGNQRTVSAMKCNFSRWKLGLAKFVGLYYWEIACAKKWLKKHQIKAIVTINDVVKPPAAFIAAGNLLKIPTVVIQHGVPGPHSAPMQASRGWVWGESSKKLLIGFGESSGKLVNVGNLEIDQCGYSDQTESREIKKLLLLSQWRASQGWGEEEFETYFATAAAAAANATDQWELIIRLHPTEGDSVREIIQKRLVGIDIEYQFSLNGNSIETDVNACDFACTINSSSMLHAVAANKPCAVIISKKLESRVGTSLFGSEYIARTGEELTQLIDKNKVMTTEERSKILANRGSGYITATENLLNQIHHGV